MADEQQNQSEGQQQYEPAESAEAEQNQDWQAGDDSEEEEDALEALAEAAENISEDHQRIKGFAADIRGKIESRREPLGNIVADEGAPGAVRESAAALLALTDGVTFLMDELADTVMSLLESTASSATDVMVGMQDWADTEVEPMLDAMGGEQAAGVPPGSVVLSQHDAQAVDQILADQHVLLNEGLKQHHSGTEEHTSIAQSMQVVVQLRQRIAQALHG